MFGCNIDSLDVCLYSLLHFILKQFITYSHYWFDVNVNLIRLSRNLRKTALKNVLNEIQILVTFHWYVGNKKKNLSI